MRNFRKTLVLVFSVLLLSLTVMPVFSYTNVKAQESRFVDQKVLAAQKWLNANYTGKYIYKPVAEDGRPGNKVVTGLIQALQIELGFGNGSTGNFGSGTMSKCPTISRSNPGSNKNIITILQHGLFCKGYGTYDDYGTFGPQTEAAVKKVQSDAGLNPDGKVTPMLFKAILNTDGLVLNYKGDPTVRQIQQALNKKYNAYFGIMPCDGIYSRSTNQALIYALQAEEGMAVGTANGYFGPGTTSKCPSLSYGDSRSNYVTLLQYALYCNGYNPGAFNGVYGDSVKTQVAKFQQFMCISGNGNADKSTLMSLFTTCGDPNRSALACDTATRLDSAKIQTLVSNGYKYVGRYLTNAKTGTLDKKMTDEEIRLIHKAGMRIFPIYQTYGGAVTYYSPAQGNEDAINAVRAAMNFGIPTGSTIYFAVDYDAYDYQVTEAILPYFRQIKARIDALGVHYNVGIYAPRNVCTRVYNAGCVKTCFVSDASSGFSGNLGYTMPKAWAFDQFKTDIKVGSGSGALWIDKVGYSGRDSGFGYIDNSLKTKVLSTMQNQVAQYNYWADPINLATGSHEIDYNIMSVNGSQNVSLSLNYSSNGTIKGQFGKGFAFNFESFITEGKEELNVYESPSRYVTYKLKKEDSNEYITDTLGKQKDILTKEADGGYKLSCNNGKKFYYNSDGLLVKEENQVGLTINVSYEDNNIVIEDGSSKQKLILEKNSKGLVTKASDEHGRKASFEYNDKDLLTKIIDVDGNKTTFTYDEVGRILTGTDNNGACYFTDSYDSFGRIVEQLDAVKNKTTFEYDDTAKDGSSTVKVTDRNGNVRSYVYSDKKQLLKLTDQNGNSTSYEYDDNGNITNTIDGRNNSETKEYNDKNLVTKETAANGAVTSYVYDENNNVTSITYDDGGKISFEYDSLNRRTKMTDLRGTVTTYIYNKDGYLSECTVGQKKLTYTYENGQIKTVTDAMGNVVTSEFDEAGNLIGTIDPLGNKIAQTNTASGKVSAMTDALGNKTTFQYNCRNEILTQTNAKGNKVSYKYDGNNNVLSKTDEKGNVTKFEYDNEDKLVKTIHPNGSEEVISYDKAGRTISKTDGEGNVTSYDLDEVGNIVKETNAKGGITTYTYTSTNKVLTETDNDGNTKTYSYDKLNRVTSIKYPNGGIKKYTYNHAGDVLTETDALGNVSKYTYDGYGNKTSFIDAMGNKYTYEYNLNDKLVKETNPLGISTGYVYDAAGHLIETIDGKGNSKKVQYDKNGNAVANIDELGNKSTIEYDSTGNVVKKTDALGNAVETYEYDAGNNVTSVTDALGNKTSFVIDAAGNVTKSVNELKQTTSYGYNKNNKLISTTNALSGVSKSSYNELNEITNLIGPLSGTTSFDYDKEGKKTAESTTTGKKITYTYNNMDLVKEITNGRNQVTSYKYDLAGRITEITTAEGTTSYTYDKNNNILTVKTAEGTITRTFDALNRVISTTDIHGNVVKYAYDAVNNITEIVYPDNTSVKYTYDKAGNMVSVTDWAGRVTSYAYDKAGRLTKTVNSDKSITEKSYDAEGNLLTLSNVKSSGEVINKYKYTYDKGNRLVKEEEVNKNIEFSYTYDDLNRVLKRVKKEKISGKTTEESFTYDAACNITSSNDLGLQMAMKYSANNALLSTNGVSTALDNDGNMTSVVINNNKFNFTYDSQNHLVKANEDVYKYDAEDYRIQGNDTKYAYDRQNKNLLVKYDADGTIEKFVYGVGLISSERSNGDCAVYHYDLRGSVTAITNKEGAVTDRYSYSTYGKQSHDEGDRVESFGYNGRDGVVTEANGLLYMRARYYSPELKRFINADVVKGEIGKSNTLNRYAYVEGNPATLIDPFGLSAEPGTKSNKSSFNWSEGIHTALDAAGFIPGLGNICDGANALFYLVQGDFGNAGLSAISLIPFGDYFAKGGKYSVKIGSHLAETGIKHADDVVKHADDIVKAGEELVTYRRVQGGVAPNASRFRIQIDANGNIRIPNKKADLNVSVGNAEHAQYFLNKRGKTAEIVEFDMPKWFDDFMKENAIDQKNYKKNPLNQGGTAPKIVDPSTPGSSYELPAPWVEWIEEYAKNGRIVKPN